MNLKEKYLKYPVFRPFVQIKNNLLFRFNGFLVGQCLHWGLATTDAIDYKKRKYNNYSMEQTAGRYNNVAFALIIVLPIVWVATGCKRFSQSFLLAEVVVKQS